MGRTAVIPASASATHSRMERRRHQRHAEQEAYARQQQGAYAQPAPAAAAAPAGLTMDEKLAQIERLAHGGVSFSDYYGQQSCTAGAGLVGSPTAVQPFTVPCGKRETRAPSFAKSCTSVPLRRPAWTKGAHLPTRQAECCSINNHPFRVMRGGRSHSHDRL